MPRPPSPPRYYVTPDPPRRYTPPRMYSRRHPNYSSSSSGTSVDDIEIPRPNHRASAHQAPRHYSSSSTLENNDPEFYSAVSSQRQRYLHNRSANAPPVTINEDAIRRQFLLNLHRMLITIPPACQAMSQTPVPRYPLSDPEAMPYREMNVYLNRLPPTLLRSHSGRIAHIMRDARRQIEQHIRQILPPNPLLIPDLTASYRQESPLPITHHTPP